MKSRQYPSFAEAKAYLESKGDLTYWGRIDKDTVIYTYKIGGKLYRLFISENGKVEVME